jgi:GNAT superfamily N-acetyltransferase
MPDATVVIRGAAPDEIDGLARLWFDGWQDAHARILPKELARHRTLNSFRERLAASLPNVRVAGSCGSPIGFALIKDDELNQLYVTASARGTGAAAALTKDALAHIVASGYQTAWLACAIGNERAARFYERTGWRRANTMVSNLATPDGSFAIEVWRYEIALPG